MPPKEAKKPGPNLTRRGLVGIFLGFTFSYRESKSAQYGSNEFFDKDAQQSTRNIELCSPRNESGTGLLAEYFSEERCNGSPMLTRIDGPVEMDSMEVWPVTRPNSVRWRGWVKPPISGDYFFHFENPLAVIHISHTKFLGREANGANLLNLIAGRYYPILIEINQLDESKYDNRLEWTAPHGMRFVISQRLLYPPN